jgi:hypothetical protein
VLYPAELPAPWFLAEKVGKPEKIRAHATLIASLRPYPDFASNICKRASFPKKRLQAFPIVHRRASIFDA